MPEEHRLVHISISEMTANAEANLIDRDREIALRDLKLNNHFHPVDDNDGPYDLSLSIEENRLVFRIKNIKGDDLPMLVLSLKPYSRLIKDYFMIVQSYDDAVKNGNPSRIEAIDMGRRGLHNEGAEMLKDRLEEKIKMDFDTARRLFTLIMRPFVRSYGVISTTTVSPCRTRMRFLRILPAVWQSTTWSFSNVTRNIAFGRTSLTTPLNSIRSSFAISLLVFVLFV